MDGLPGGLASVVQLHTLSIDLAAHVIQESDGPSSLSKATLPAFAAVRKQASTVSSESFRDQLPALPSPDTKRRARQAALRRARAAREDTEGHRVAPVVSINDISTAGSDADLTTQSSTSSGTDGLAGPLRKRGRKTKIQMKRHFVLVGSTLYNYRSKRDTKPSWKLNLTGTDVRVGTDAVNGRIVLFLDGGRQLVLYARTPQEVEVWGSALARAAECANEFFRNDSPTCVTQQRFERSSEEFADDQTPVQETEIDVVDMARMVKENAEWDSFRSFSALQMRTSWKRQE